jgi:hypothetical protein
LRRIDSMGSGRTERTPVAALFVAAQPSAYETKRPFAVRTKASLMKLITDILEYRICVGSGLAWQDEDEVFVREGAQFGPTSRRSADRRRFDDLPILDGIAEKGVNSLYTSGGHTINLKKHEALARIAKFVRGQ